MKVEKGSLNGMDIAVIGGTSKIARRTIIQAREMGANVRALVRDMRKGYELEQAGVVLYEGDITDRESVERVLFDGSVDATINFAAVFDQNKASASATAVNVRGEQNVVNVSEAHGVRRHILISTTGVHVKSPYAYGDTKLEAEDIVEKSDIPEWMILRFANVLGTQDKHDLWNSPHMTVEIAGKRIGISKLPYRKNAPFSYLSAENASNAVIAALSARPNQTLTVIDGYTTMDIYLSTMARINDVHELRRVDGRHVINALYVAESLAEMFGRQMPVTTQAAEFMYTLPVDVIGTSESMQSELGLTPIPFEEIFRSEAL